MSCLLFRDFLHCDGTTELPGSPEIMLSKWPPVPLPSVAGPKNGSPNLRTAVQVRPEPRPATGRFHHVSIWVLVDSFASRNKCLTSSNRCLTSSNKKLVITILIKFLLLVRHLLLLAWHLFLVGPKECSGGTPNWAVSPEAMME